MNTVIRNWYIEEFQNNIQTHLPEEMHASVFTREPSVQPFHVLPLESLKSGKLNIKKKHVHEQA
jgi:hypothetical protein